MPNDAELAQMEVFWKLHAGLPKQGPGSDASTRRALAMLPELPASPEILDLGCGPGRQSLVLAQQTGGHVIAIDLLAPFLAQLDESAKAKQLDARIKTAVASMGDLSYEDERFDLLWSEGAIYNIGFSHGLESWRRLLRPGGAVAVTELSWLVDSPPPRVREFWKANHPAMQSREANEAAVAAAGYELLGSFVLPEADWWGGYFTLIEERVAVLRQERSDAAWLAVLDAEAEELEVLREAEGSFGYVFYVMQKPVDGA